MNSMFDNILGQVSNALGGLSGQQSGMAGSVLNLINSQPGGPAGLVTSLQQKGLANEVASWIGTGQNLSISPEQIQKVLGNEAVQKFATAHGIDVNQASEHLSKILPAMMDQMTPSGTLPQTAR